MSITDRDRKILLFLIPIAIVVAYWFMLLQPQRDKAAKVRDELSQVQGQRDTARQAAAQLGSAKRSFAKDYATVIYLGKSTPTSLDMPSLLVQLDRAARGTGIDFVDIAAGGGSGGAAPSTSTPPGGNNTSSGPAQSGPGKAGQSAANSVASANGTNSANAAAAGGSAGGSSSGGSNAQGLNSVPLDFEFTGSFFDLADFFHRMKRFVRVANDRIIVRGRLLTINSFSFDTGQTFPKIDAKVHATVYLAPKSQGVAAGASPSGPAGSSTPAGQQASSGSSATPTATVTTP